jgi:hypothetical protein
MNEYRPIRTPEEETRERRRTARHEAGYAVAALHYGCGIRNISIGGVWPIRKERCSIRSTASRTHYWNERVSAIKN